MDKKPLIGVSICAIVLLVLSSLSNVVGYQSVKSTTVNDSPLFNIRTNKATNNENNRVITSAYLGKGLNALSFPLRDNRMGQIQKVIEIIEKMNDKEFKRFQSLVLSRFYEEKNIINIDTTQLVTILKQLKSNTKELESILNNNANNTNDDPATLFSMWDGCCPTFYVDPHCYFHLLIAILILFLFWPEILLYGCIAGALTLDNNWCYP
jgi:hypothetical protein